MERLRGFGGAQPYPSRVKDGGEVDFSTGSVGLGVAITSFSALMADYVRLHGLMSHEIAPGRHIAIAGDAELDEAEVGGRMPGGRRPGAAPLYRVTGSE